MKTLGLEELSIHSIRWTARTLKIHWPYLTSPAEFDGTSGATGGSDGGGLAADAGDNRTRRAPAPARAQRSAPGTQDAAATPVTVTLYTPCHTCAHVGPPEEPAAQREGAAGVRAPRRSDYHRTPSRRLADAVADAAGRQHGALMRQSGQLMGSRHAPVKADRSRAGGSQHSYSPRPQQPCCQHVRCLLIASVRTWTQACTAKGLVSLQPDSEHYLCADHWNAGSPLARRHCCSHSVPLPPTPKSAQDFSRAGTGAGTACCPVADRPAQSYASTLCLSFASSAC